METKNESADTGVSASGNGNPTGAAVTVHDRHQHDNHHHDDEDGHHDHEHPMEWTDLARIAFLGAVILVLWPSCYSWLQCFRPIQKLTRNITTK